LHCRHRNSVSGHKFESFARIADLVREKNIDGISYLRDESDRDGMRMVSN